MIKKSPKMNKKGKWKHEKRSQERYEKQKNYRGAHRQDHLAAIKTNPTVLKPDIALKKFSRKSMQTH